MTDTTDLPLFAPHRPIARSADPEPSHEAARILAATGELARQKAGTLVALLAWSGWPDATPTAHELAGPDRERFRVYGRRLPDLRETGFVENTPARTCRITHRLALTWSLTPEGRRLAHRLAARAATEVAP